MRIVTAFQTDQLEIKKAQAHVVEWPWRAMIKDLKQLWDNNCWDDQHLSRVLQNTYCLELLGMGSCRMAFGVEPFQGRPQYAFKVSFKHFQHFGLERKIYERIKPIAAKTFWLSDYFVFQERLETSEFQFTRYKEEIFSDMFYKYRVADVVSANVGWRKDGTWRVLDWAINSDNPTDCMKCVTAGMKYCVCSV